MSKAFNSINGANWQETVDLDLLRDIRNPSLGNRHVPVNHGDILEMFKLRAVEQGMTLGEECGYLAPEQNRFIYVAEVQVEAELAYSIGFINFNDRTRSFVGLAGERVFCCTNLCFGGVFNPSKTRHTTYVDDRLDDKVDSIFQSYKGYVDKMKYSMGFLKQREVDDTTLGRVLLELHRSEILGATNVQRVQQEFDNPTFNDKTEPANGWRLHNAFTHVLKKIKNPILNIDSGNAGRNIVLKTLGY